MGGAPGAALIGLALALAGAGFASQALLVAGLGMLGLAVLSEAWVWLSSFRLELHRAPGPVRAIEGEAYPLRIEARGRLAPPPGGSLRDPLLERPLPVGPRWDGRHEEQVELHGRGRRELGSAELEIRDPLGLSRRRRRSAPAGELIVLPRIEPIVLAERAGVAGGALRALARGAGAPGRFAPTAIEPEVDGLRPHREGSPASRIHWPAVARSGELIERRLVAGGRVGPLVILDASLPAGEPELDAAVRAAASLAFHLAAAGGCALHLPAQRRALELDRELRGWEEAHTRLALVAAGAPAPAPTRRMRGSEAFWVTAAATPRPPASLLGPGQTGYLVAPTLPARGRSFSVAGCNAIPWGAGARRPARPALAAARP